MPCPNFILEGLLFAQAEWSKRPSVSSYQTWANKNFGVNGGKLRLQFHPIYLPSRQVGLMPGYDQAVI